jgi:type III secretion protein J
MSSLKDASAPRQSGSWRALLLLSILALAGCKQAIYTQLNETEANDVLLTLIRGGIEAEKRVTDDKQFAVYVRDADVATSIELLRADAQPAQRFSSLGDVFDRNGLISSPTEERMRYIHGLQQELSHTLSEIDGVVVARVHIVVPAHDALDTVVKPSSASVFIKHRPDLNMQLLVPAVKDLVVRSIEGLGPDTVAVSLFPARATATTGTQIPLSKFFGATVAASSTTILWILFAIPWLLVAAMLVMLLHASSLGPGFSRLLTRRKAALMQRDSDARPTAGREDRRAA